MSIEDRSYGVIVIFNDNFLCLQHKAGHWGFPKGHIEGDETIEEASLRELKEEAGIEKCDIFAFPPIFEEYEFEQSGRKYHKIVQYLVGRVIDDKLIIQQKEIMDYKWASYEEALETLTYDNNKEVLKKAKEYLGKLNVVK